MAAAPDAATWGYYSVPEADAPFCFAAEQVCEADMAGSGDDWPMHLEFSPDGLSVLAQGSDRSTRVWGIPQISFVHSVRLRDGAAAGRQGGPFQDGRQRQADAVAFLPSDDAPAVSARDTPRPWEGGALCGGA